MSYTTDSVIDELNKKGIRLNDKYNAKKKPFTDEEVKHLIWLGYTIVDCEKRIIGRKK